MTTPAGHPLPSTPLDFKQQAYAVWEYLKEKAKDGLLIGLVFILIVFFDQSRYFVEYLDSNLSGIPLPLVVLGAICSSIYIINNHKYAWITRASLSWIELNQQFFSIAVGAYPLIRVGTWLGSENGAKSFEFWQTLVIELVFIFAAVLFGGWWKLQNQPVAPWAKWFARSSILVGGYLLVTFMLTDGGVGILKDAMTWLENGVAPSK